MSSRQAHLVTGIGVTAVLEQLLYTLCNENDRVLIAKVLHKVLHDNSSRDTLCDLTQTARLLILINSHITLALTAWPNRDWEYTLWVSSIRR